MSTADIGGRPVLRPAGNVARATLRKVTKPPPSPVKPQVLPPPSSKISPPNSQPSTPKTAISSPARNPLFKPLSPSKLSPKKTPSPSPVSLHQADQALLPHTPLHLSPDGSISDICDIVSSCHILELSSDGPSLSANDPFTSVNGSSPSPPLGSASTVDRSKPSLYGSSLVNGGGNGSKISSHVANSSCKGSNPSPNGSEPLSSVGKTSQNVSKSSSHPAASRTQKTINPHIILNKSTSDVFQKGPSSHVKAKPTTSKKNLSKFGSLSFDESSLATMVAAKKAAANEVNVQRKLKVSEYGRKQGKASRIAPDVSTTLLSPPVELKRCKFITAQSDPLYVAYHDQEWGVPMHEDRLLFELLVLTGFQGELSWTTILHKREAYRDAFAGFDPSAVALFKEKHIQSLEADKGLGLPAGKLRGVVDNAQRLLEVVHEFGSFDEYMWGFLNKQPMMNNYRYPKQVPVKTSKAESISKDLVKRGFRFVGPTIIYSFMQASGMTNDHLVECFRHRECMKLSSPSGDLHEEKQEVGLHHEDGEVNMRNLDFGLEKEEGLEVHLVDRGCDCEQDECSQEPDNKRELNEQ